MKNNNAGEQTTQETNKSAQIRVIEELQEYSHCFIDEKNAKELLSPFGIDASQHISKYECDYSDPKGLHGYNKEQFITGLSAFDIPDIIMKKLGIEYTGMSFLGRGRQFRSEVEFISDILKSGNF